MIMEVFTESQIIYMKDVAHVVAAEVLADYIKEQADLAAENDAPIIKASGIYTVKQAAEVLKKSHETIATYCQKGILKATKASKAFRSPWSIAGWSILEFLARLQK